MIFGVFASLLLSLQFIFAEEQRHCSSSSSSSSSCSSSSSSSVEADCHWCHKHGRKGHRGSVGPVGKEGVIGAKGDVGPKGFSGYTGPGRINQAFFSLRSGAEAYRTPGPTGALQFDNVVVATSNFTIYAPNDAVIISDPGTYRFTWSARTLSPGSNYIRFNDTTVGLQGDVVPGTLYATTFEIESPNYMFGQAILETINPYTAVQLMFSSPDGPTAYIYSATFGIQRLK